MHHSDFTIATLIAKHLAGSMEPQEQAQLDEWINESEHNRLLFEKLICPDSLHQWQQKISNYDTSIGWSQLLQKQKVQRRRRSLFRLGYAAGFLILITSGYLYFFTGQRSVPAALVSEPEPTVPELIVPGGTKATLTLADGSAVALSEHSDYKIEDSPVNHKIETPRGGEYAFTLSDGTFVRLNAMTTIHFPITFGQEPRVVELEGEAFFKVEDTGQPFIIKTKDMVIEVMGTSFNISSYSDEACSSVTLVSGAIKVQDHQGGDGLMLTPSQQVLFDRKTNEMSVRQVDVSTYIAWSNGVFYFKDWTLEEIMNYLSRWYDFDEVVYRDEHLKTIMFGCKFSKYDQIDLFLRAFERTNKVKYQIENKTIIFSQFF